MYNSKFILTNGQDLYPGYLSLERRQMIRDKYKDTRGYMRCGCKPNAKLYYRISEDLRIYPEHNNYQHDIFCCRYKDESGIQERQTAYVINDESGEVVAFTSFDPFSFTQEVPDSHKEQDNIVPTEEDDNMEEIVVEKDNDTIKPAQKKEPKLSIGDLIRSINVDSFTEKILNNQTVTAPEKFSVLVYYRMKKVRLFRGKKNIGELTLEKDGCRFMYLPFAGIQQKEENGTKKCYLQTKSKDGKIYNNFIFPDIMRKAAQDFTKRYGIMPDEHTMVAGFQYLKKTKHGRTYKVMGRIHLFQISDIGIYCRSMTELLTFNCLQTITEENSDIRYWIPPEDPSVGAIVAIRGMQKKILLLFRTGKDEPVTYDSSMYVPYVVDSNTNVTAEKLYDLLSDTTADEEIEDNIEDEQTD